VKRWRYAIDLFASGAGVQATAGRDERDRLEATQDALGELCDLFTARRLSAELKLTPELAHSLTAAIERRHRQCLARAETDLNAVMHALVLRD
jgi:CHAD domain-containing protein